MTLDQIVSGQDFLILGLTSKGEIRRRLLDMGFVNGARGRLVRKSPLRGPLEVQLGCYLVSLRVTEANGIEVQDPALMESFPGLSPSA